MLTVLMSILMSVSIFCQKLEFVNLVMSMLNVKPACKLLGFLPLVLVAQCGPIKLMHT